MIEDRKMVPKLRFPEFRDAAGWEAKTLGNEGELLSSLTGKAGADFDAGEARFVTYMNVFSNTFVDPKALRFVDVKEGENQNAVESGDVFFTISSETPDEVGMSSVLLNELENCYLNSFCALFRFSKSKRLNPVFVGYLLRQPLVRSYFAKKAQGSTRFNLSKDAFRSLPLCVPSPPEQQKIADCLSSLDELIAAQARKVDALKTHKKGLMQQLFPREGETQPRLRFPEFRDTEDWEKSQLNRLTTKISDGIHTTPVYDENGEYAFINGNNLVNGRVLVDGKTKRVSLHEFKKHRKPLNANTILMSINGTIGNLALFRNEQVVLGKSACFINVDTDLADSFFIYYLLQTGSVQSVFNAELTGSTIKNLSLGTIKNTAVSIPRLPEQQRIASFLFLLDDLITAQTQELETLKTHKKGLIQQLFPLAEAA